jgi:hypothetical protein
MRHLPQAAGRRRQEGTTLKDPARPRAARTPAEDGALDVPSCPG